MSTPQDPVFVNGRTAMVNVPFTRPADTTAYAALDVVGPAVTGLLQFAGLGRVLGGSGYITKARLETDQAANVARYRLHLFHTAPTAIADNSPYTLLWANRDKRIGYIDFAASAQEGTGSNAACALNATARLPFVCPAGDSTIYGILETLDAFTPVSGQNYFVELTVEQN